MILSKPTLFKRADKSKPAKNTFLGDIEQYFTATNNTCVHFGQSGDWYNAINLLKTNADITGLVSHAEVCEALCDLYPNNEFIKDSIFFAKHNIDYKIVIINDKCDWRTENNSVLIVDFKFGLDENVAMIKSIIRVQQQDFQKYLVAKFGINRTYKPLIYATTEFEGFLSSVSTVGCNRDDITLFPGDVDLITYSNCYNTFDVFEFKKHTSFGGNSTLAEQSFLKYLDRDRKKYFGIANFTKYLGKNYFYNVLYSTRIGEEKIVKIEKVKLESGILKLDDTALIEFDTKEDLIYQIKNFTLNNY